MTENTPINKDKLQQYLQTHQEEALNNLRQLVEINSFTHNSAGVNKVGDLLESLFKPLGFTAKRPQAIECVMADDKPLGKHLILKRQGKSNKTIGLVGHLDTVFTKEDETENNFHWRKEGERIYGPGTCDIKGGNIQIWLVLKALQEIAPKLFDDINWVVMFNAAEEGLASDFGILERQNLGKEALANLVFESSSYTGGTSQLISSRKGRARFRLQSFGRAAHAGAQHEKGASAILQLSRAVEKFSAITDYKNDLTANVGMITGGATTNRVPDFAQSYGEIRAFDNDILDNAVKQAMSLNGMSDVTSASDGYKAKVEITCHQHLPAWLENQKSKKLAKLFADVGKTVDINIGNRARGGLSDGNFTFDIVPTIDGLGPAGANAHCAKRNEDRSVDQEYVLPESIVPMAMIAALGIERLSE